MPIDESAPVITRADILIAAPIQRIWDLQTGVNAWPSWRPDVSAAHLDGPFVPGVTFTWSTSGLEIASTIAAVDAPHSFEWGGPAQGIVAVHHWSFTEEGDSVRVATAESWAGPAIDADAPAMQSALDASLGDWLRFLRDAAERDD